MTGFEVPLDGLRVLDFAQFLAGPVAALRLSDLGAEVVKIERPNGGDLCRSMVVNNQRLDGDSLVFHTFNRGKKSVAADLKDAGDLARVRDLIAGADVMIHNFRPGVMERIGLGYDDVRALNPQIVYGAVSGYGTAGPWRDKPGQDLLIQALSGIGWLNGNDGDGPVPIGFAMLDVATAANLVQGILACLVRRGVTGTGGLVEVDLLSSAIDMTFEQFTCFLNDGQTQPKRHAFGNANPYQPAPYGVYPTSDGYLAFAMTPLSVVARVLNAPEIAQYAQDDAFAKLNEIKALVSKVIEMEPTDHWIDVLAAAGIWCAPVLDWNGLVASDGFAAMQAVHTMQTGGGAKADTTRLPMRIDGQVMVPKAAAPKLGADTDAIFGRTVGAE